MLLSCSCKMIPVNIICLLNSWQYHIHTGPMIVMYFNPLSGDIIPISVIFIHCELPVRINSSSQNIWNCYCALLLRVWCLILVYIQSYDYEGSIWYIFRRIVWLLLWIPFSIYSQYEPYTSLTFFNEVNFRQIHILQ